MRRAPHRENPNETFASWNQPNDYDRNHKRTPGPIIAPPRPVAEQFMWRPGQGTRGTAV